MKTKRKTLSSLLCLFLVCALLGSLCMPVLATDNEDTAPAETEEVTEVEQESTEEAAPTEEAPTEEAPEEEPPAEEPPAEDTPEENAEDSDQDGTEVDVERPDGWERSQFETMEEAREAMKNGTWDGPTVSCGCWDMNDGTILVLFDGAYRGDMLHDETYMVVDLTISEILLNDTSVPFTTDGYYATVDADTVNAVAAESETGTIRVEIVAYTTGKYETWTAGIVRVQPEEPAIVVDIYIAASDYIDKETPVAYVDDGLTVDYTVEGDLTPATVYLNGVAVPFEYQATGNGADAPVKNAGAGANGTTNLGSASQGGRIVLSSQTLNKYGKVDEINTLDVVFSVGGSKDQTVPAQTLEFMLKSKVVADGLGNKDNKKPETKPENKDAVTTPNTGDTFQPVLWIVLIAVSAVGLTAVNVYRRKKNIRYFG